MTYLPNKQKQQNITNFIICVLNLAKGVKFYEFSEFRYIREIGRGRNGIVYLATCYNEGAIVFKKSTKIKKLNEIKQLIKANEDDGHLNINKFLGITIGWLVAYKSFQNESIPGTPSDYGKLCNECCVICPKDRPELDEILCRVLQSKGATEIITNEKTIQLTNGNLVFDHPVPNWVLNKVSFISDEEFTHIRYTAITCDPDKFINKQYSIRQKNYKRNTEIMIVITMYNESDIYFIKTISSVINNVAYMCSKKKSKTWGNEGWKKIVVLIVSDG
ncbi:23867_t:CDS:2, partial [Gigaspora margarita]